MSDNPREAKHPVQEIADAVGGTITEMHVLPDGSGFAIMSMPLKKDHWIYQGDRQESWGVSNVPPMPFRMGAKDVIRLWPYRLPIPGITTLNRQAMSDRIRAAGKYAIRCATMNGKEMDFDPDAMLQNLVVGFLGYGTETGMSEDAWANPQERTQWCCDGDGQGGHNAKCRHSQNNSAENSVQSPPSQG
jgi:hypothetical protein